MLVCFEFTFVCSIYKYMYISAKKSWKPFVTILVLETGLKTWKFWTARYWKCFSVCIDWECMFYWEYIHWKIKVRRTYLQNVILWYISVSKGQSIHIPSVLWLVTWQNWILILGKIEHSFILCRGGLAERLCRLQNRERSAISFWRHQCISDAKIPSGKKHYTYTAVWKYILTCVYICPV